MVFSVEIIGIKFKFPNEYGDFYWMCNQKKFSGSLFIFNDNEESHETSEMGGGNATIRIFNKYSDHNPPKSAGIPTGTLAFGGYQKFTPRIKKVIDDSFDEIKELIKKYNYHTLYFSSEPDGKIGTSIFRVDDKVRNYITHNIYNLSTNHVKIVTINNNSAFGDKFDFDDFDNDSDNGFNSD